MQYLIVKIKKLFFYLLIPASIITYGQRNIKVDITTCSEMLVFLESLKETDDLKKHELELNKILESDSYKIMFQHYNRDWRPNHLPPKVFKNMILSLKYPKKYIGGENKRADQMLPHWKLYFNNLEKFEKEVKELQSINFHKMVIKAINTAENWLPENMKVGDLYVTIHPNGGSSGFKINDAQGYDFFKLFRDSTGSIQFNVLEEIIAHECHHSGLKIPEHQFDNLNDSLTYKFITYLIGEGTANKFINNCSGGSVPKIFPDRINTLMDAGKNVMTKKLWKTYTETEQEIFDEFFSLYKETSEGKYTEEEFNKKLGELFFSGVIGMGYFMGSEIFGAIYLGFGKETCFEAMNNPKMILKLYNNAIEKGIKKLKNCPKIPEDIVQHSLKLY